MKIFDIHPHVISPDTARYPQYNVLDHTEAHNSERPVDTERMLAEMDAAGIEHAVLVQTFLVYGYDNSYVADSAAAHSDRFAWVGSVDARAADGPAQLRALVREKNMDGLRVFASYGEIAKDSDWLADPETMPTWQAAAELDIPVCVMMKATSLPVLAKVVERFPTLRFVLDHIGAVRPADPPSFPSAGALWALADRPNVYLKLTSSVIERSIAAGVLEPLMRRCIGLFGANRIAWGSNYPTSAGPLTRLVDFAQTELAFLSAAEREAIFNGTARSLYPRFDRTLVPGGRS
jgi:predicted TIM-barrel fold metal-dependent hydrolase